MKATTNDPIVTEVRSVRDKHAARLGYDIRAIFKDIQDEQAASGREFVRCPARPVKASTNENGRSTH